MSQATGQPPQAAMRFVRLSQAPDASSIGELLSAGAEVTEHDQSMWIRLSASVEGSQALLSKLAGQPYLNVDRQVALPDERKRSSPALLRRPGQAVPTASLPADLQWQAIDQWFGFELPTPAIGSRATLLDRPTLQLERGGELRTAAALRVSLADLAAWIDTAAAVRMQPLRWLCHADQALVFGQPLPPLEGVMLTARDQVLLPLGFRWRPALPSLSVLQAFCAAEPRDSLSAWLIWESSDRWSVVDDGDWAALTRASVRAALDNCGDGERSRRRMHE